MINSAGAEGDQVSAYFRKSGASLGHGELLPKISRRTITAIQGIGKTIAEMDHIAGTIAAAMEQQGAVTVEISCNVHQAARGTGQVSDSISNVKRSAGETDLAAGNVLGAARQLTEHSKALRREVCAFLADVKVA